MARELTVRELNARTTREHFRDRPKPGLVRVTRSDKLIVSPEHAAHYSRAGCNVTYSRNGEVCIVTEPRKARHEHSETVRVQSGKCIAGKITRRRDRASQPVYNPAPVMASPVDEKVFYRKAVTE